MPQRISGIPRRRLSSVEKIAALKALRETTTPLMKLGREIRMPHKSLRRVEQKAHAAGQLDLLRRQMTAYRRHYVDNLILKYWGEGLTKGQILERIRREGKSNPVLKRWRVDETGMPLLKERVTALQQKGKIVPRLTEKSAPEQRAEAMAFVRAGEQRITDIAKVTGVGLSTVSAMESRHMKEDGRESVARMVRKRELDLMKQFVLENIDLTNTELARRLAVGRHTIDRMTVMLRPVFLETVLMHEARKRPVPGLLPAETMLRDEALKIIARKGGRPIQLDELLKRAGSTPKEISHRVSYRGFRDNLMTLDGRDGPLSIAYVKGEPTVSVKPAFLRQLKARYARIVGAGK